MNMIKITESINLENYTLIIPSICVGNVSQLVIDLLISNLNFHKIGQIFNPAFVPVVGLDPYNESSKEVCTTIDIYAEIKEKIVAIQVRSPYINSLKDFFSSLKEFAQEQKINKVIILTSSYAYKKEDGQLNSFELRYLASKDIISISKDTFNDLFWIKHEIRDIHTNNEGKTNIPGGGFAADLYHFLSLKDIPCAVLYKFCSEGDNIPDAIDLINYLNQWLKFFEVSIKDHLDVIYPLSWKHLFGNPNLTEVC